MSTKEIGDMADSLLAAVEGAENNISAVDDALQINDAPWKYKEPKAQPLHYHVPSDAQGGTVIKTINSNVDFNDRESVYKANKRRHQDILRAHDRFGLNDNKKRESMKGREYEDRHVEFAVKETHRYADDTGGDLIPINHLTAAFNQEFPGENRTETAIRNWASRDVTVKAARASYTK